MLSRKHNYAAQGLWSDQQIGWLLDTAAGRWREREFLRLGSQRYSFEALANWSHAVAGELVQRRVLPGDRVLIQAGNCIELLVLQFAAWRIGAVAVPVVSIYRSHEVRAIIAKTRPAVVAASRTAGSSTPCAALDALMHDMAYEPAAKLAIGPGEAIDGWSEFPSQPTSALAEMRLPDPAEADACCLILFTSGTTSEPKGVMLSSHSLLAAAENWRYSIGINANDVSISGAPLTHIGALSSAILAPLAMGARTVIMPGWAAKEAVSLIEEERATYSAGAAVFLHDMVALYEAGASSAHRLQVFVSGGAPTPPALSERAERLGIKAIRVYGMTETCGPITQSARDASYHERALTDGRTAFGTEISIVDEQRHPVQRGMIGSVRLRSPQLMIGYTEPALNAGQLDEEGWFYPGDLGYVAEDGTFSMVGRTKDIINRGGEKFSAQDIEVALVACQGIEKAAVIALPDTRYGEIVCACVILRTGTSWQGPEPVLAQLSQFGLAKQKFPVEWAVMTEFPQTASGKVQKELLFKIVAEQTSRA